MFKVVLLEPQIPQNTGNIARLCAATEMELIIVGQPGFSLQDKYLKRAGLDYWEFVRIKHVPDVTTFLAELDREVRRLEDTGDIRPFQTRAGWSPEGNGGNLVGLLSFMNSNGVRFASSKPSDEPVYHNLFVMMRSLYLTVAEDDESIQPVKLRDLVDHP